MSPAPLRASRPLPPPHSTILRGVCARRRRHAGGLSTLRSAAHTPLNQAPAKLAHRRPQTLPTFRCANLSPRIRIEIPNGFHYVSGDVISVLARPLASSSGSLSSDNKYIAFPMSYLKKSTLISHNPYTCNTAGFPLYNSCSMYILHSQVEP